VERVGQTVLTCATAACFDGLRDGAERVALGRLLRFFGDRYQSSKVVDGRRYWRVPVMEGEFLCEESVGVQKAIGGGNILILAETAKAALEAAECAVEAMRMPGVVMPFPGGVVRSGSKVGARHYKKMIASTNDAFCPTLRGRRRVKSELPEGVNCVLEIVVNGLGREAIQASLRRGIEAACLPGVVEISAGNYGGKLGKHLFPLHELFPRGTGS
jgi:formylmethanofuran--tetrahydromethanopterin N-formyltransferase